MNYTASHAGATTTMGSLLSNTVAYAANSGQMRGKTKSLKFTDEQRDEAVTK